MSDECNVNHPTHYTSQEIHCAYCYGPIECRTVARTFNFNLGNAIKYIWRCDFKGKDIEDLEKAINYLRNEIERRQQKIKIKEESNNEN